MTQPATRGPRLLPPEGWSERSVAERARALESACIAAMQIIASTPEGGERLARIDPVPASTLRIIRKLATGHRHAGTTADSH